MGGLGARRFYMGRPARACALRALGLAGVLLAAPAGIVLAADALPPTRFWQWERYQAAYQLAVDEGGDTQARVGAALLLGGAAALVLWLLVEVIGVEEEVIEVEKDVLDRLFSRMQRHR